jgi:hypothetical protein
MKKIGILLVVCGAVVLYLLAVKGITPEAAKEQAMARKALVPLKGNMAMLAASAALLAIGCLLLSRGGGGATFAGTRFAPTGPDRSPEKGLLLQALLGAGVAALLLYTARGDAEPKAVGAIAFWLIIQAAACISLSVMVYLKKSKSMPLFLMSMLLIIPQIVLLMMVMILGA